MSQREIIGKFDADIENIEFYEIMNRYKNFTIIRMLGTDNYYIWEEKNRILSTMISKDQVPRSKEEFDNIFENIRDWGLGAVFFWAESKFVTQYGLEGYDKLINLYREMVNCRFSEIMLNRYLESIKQNVGLFQYFLVKLKTLGSSIERKRIMNKLGKEYDLIW